MNIETTAELLERVARENASESWHHMAQAQAAALAKAAEGTITISAEGLPSREELVARADEYLPGSTVLSVLTRVAEAMPEPVPPLPTAPWSSVTTAPARGDIPYYTPEPFTTLWLLHANGLWNTSNDHGTGLITATPNELDQMSWTLLHDAGAGQ